jgi:uncharacterized protein (UPF0276 family)
VVAGAGDAVAVTDRFGVSFRKPLAAGILNHLDEIDVVEVMADDYEGVSRDELDVMRALGRARPISLHGVSLGLASSHPVERSRLDRMARVVEALAAESWSEHLAFVRAGGVELGHLCSPPRTTATIDGTLRNLERARGVVGTMPTVENIAGFLDAPASTMDEPTWVSSIVGTSGAPLLLDLHNLHTNAINIGFDARDALLRMPLDRVKTVHIAGGAWAVASSGEQRWCDDHLHETPSDVYALLEELASRASQPIDVVLERDGAYPVFEVLLGEIRAARAAVSRGRTRASEATA